MAILPTYGLAVITKSGYSVNAGQSLLAVNDAAFAGGQRGLITADDRKERKKK